MKCPRCEDSSVFGLKNEHEWKEMDGSLKCTGCGSISPEEFMQRVEAGELITPTDKNYKVYVGDGRVKFYFQHLSVEQMKKFIESLNARKLKFDEPGYFYVKPYFCIVQGRN